jgi:pyruvate/2-oxoglutarate dehydrogenase complex dihydrolipoamide dehydrogenase (E3) component
MSEFKLTEPLDQYDQQLLANVHPRDWKNPIPSSRYNLVVVGGGTAGLVAAAGAAGLGAKVALIERGFMGGDCLNVGCVPSKTLISVARQCKAIRGAGDSGFNIGEVQVDFPRVMERMRRLRAGLSTHDSVQRFRGLGVDVYLGAGCFTRKNTIEVGDQNLEFKKAVIATGARATIPSIPGLDESEYLTNESLFSLRQLPKHLVIVGGGPLGCEMAQCFARFGSQVTLIEGGNQILSQEEPEAAALVQSALESDGVRILLATRLIRAERVGMSRSMVVSNHEKETTIGFDEILLSVGRTPNVAGLGLELVGVDHDLQSGVAVDDFLRTTNPCIYAAGDVCSRFKFTHAADAMSRIVIQNALFMGRKRMSKLLIPRCTYTSPEIAQVGMLPRQAAEHGIKLVQYSQPFRAVDRAVLEGNDVGYVSVYCRQGSDQIMGATVVAANAGDLIGEIVLAMKHRIGLAKLAAVIHPYPTHADAIRKLGDLYNRQRLTPWVQSVLARWMKWIG